MNKLLYADFSRLWKNKLFWACIAFNLFAEGFLSYDTAYWNNIYSYNNPLENTFYYYIIIMMIIAPIFTAMFIGTEYSNGTFRNKLVVGHSRLAVYVSNLTTCSIANLIISAAGIIGGLAVGIPLLGTFEMPLNSAVYLIFCSMLTVIAMTALVTLISMLTDNKATNVVVCILIAAALLFTSSKVINALNAPEITSMYWTDDMQPVNPIPNPAYIDGTQRMIYEFIIDFLPTGQALQTGYVEQLEHRERLWYFSLIFTAAATAIGSACFNKKDLR